MKAHQKEVHFLRYGVLVFSSFDFQLLAKQLEKNAKTNLHLKVWNHHCGPHFGLNIRLCAIFILVLVERVKFVGSTDESVGKES